MSVISINEVKRQKPSSKEVPLSIKELEKELPNIMNAINNGGSPFIIIDHLIMNVKNNVEEGDMKYNGLQLSYFYKNNINKDEIETKIQQKHSIQLKEGTTIQWEKVSDISYYEIFIFNDNATDLEYVDNDCYLSSISNSTSNKNNQDYIYYKISNQSIDSFDIEREGNFTVNIVGVIEAEIPMRLEYGQIN